MLTLKELMMQIKKANRRYNITKIESAYELASTAHEGCFRESGEPYITHPLSVASILVELGMDSDCICAAILHDVVEDTDVKIEEIEKKFGRDVARIVNGVTKLNALPLHTKEEQQAENMRKMLFAMADDIRVMIIKLADRLHNMRTLSPRTPQKQRDTSLETLEIYSPIANRLGMRTIKEEMEDIALMYLDPVAYNEITEKIEHKKVSENFLKQVTKTIEHHLKLSNVKSVFESRVKNKYGIYRKVYMAGKDFDEVYDIFAVRIIVDTVSDCYVTMGIIHAIFSHIPNRFKDYIATPKQNRYQSLHTTVIGKEKIPFEVQIRTKDMNYTAEYGVAAHWKYKEGFRGKTRDEKRLDWLRQIIEAQKDSDDVEDLVRYIKSDMGSEEVLVHTPKGEPKILPSGSTVVDFAYAIHTEVGNKMTGAKIDGRIVSLGTQIQTGQVIEILTAKNKIHGPSRDWLKIVRTSEAKSKIKAWFKKERYEENILEGKIELEREFRRNSINLSGQAMDNFIESIAKRQKFDSVQEFFAAIGYGGLSLSKIIPRIKEDFVKLIKDESTTAVIEEIIPKVKMEESAFGQSGINVEGMANCLVKSSRCCNPLPGEKIIGFITRGHGVSVHRIDCHNVKIGLRDPNQVDRYINVSWSSDVPVKYRAVLDIVAVDRDNLMLDINLTLASFKLGIHEMNARELKNGNANIIATVGITGVEQLRNTIAKLGKINGVISVKRTGK
ncbi:MAG: bifunctional (p)ppGpp synthetase/guanosine-3',5'-bis(diphosphate) 3'-pyrophosphohydrolase [Oscillospiraceae bacterium]|nr:bifunctional (p)ppGpp synthetase/guanosine-3',5'-bis(diphosphate) 3'-pyrophosphohydrolase [Oscillospiraceae bacterium]